MTCNVDFSSDRRGKYFGICASYHHSKGCKCLECPSYPEAGTFMFCSKGAHPAAQKKGCMCSECIIFKKFGLQGEYFCIG